MIRFVVGNLRAVFRILTGGEKYNPSRELGPFQMWARAAAECGVENVVTRRFSLLAPPRIEGARPPLTVSIWPVGSAGSAHARIIVRGVPKEIGLRHESLRTKASLLVGGSEVTVGDALFDSCFFVKGDPLVVRACLDAEARTRAMELFGPAPSVAAELLGVDFEVGIADGAITARFVDHGFPHAPLTPAEQLGRALALGERLVVDVVEERLASVARTDPQSGVRLAALGTLQEARPEHPATRAALEAGCVDVDPRVRLAAASGLGAKAGQRTLFDLATDVDVDDAVSAHAVTELRSLLPVEHARTVLSEALRTRRLETAAACVDRLGRGGEDADLIARVLEREAGALGIAAARALGRCGTADHVPLLREVESRHPPPGPLAVACRGAVASIHTRQPGASQGRLSLAEDRSGRLSVPSAQGGEVSVTPGPQEEGPKVR